ncbi:MAG TPA: hypothetical protein PLV42_07735 [bacterium]|nr:hypothetical protein [bacterium]
MRFALSFLLSLLFATPMLNAGSKVLILPPAWESSALKGFARDMDKNCEDLLPAIKNAAGFCATTTLPGELRHELARCKGNYGCLKKKIRLLEEYDIVILSSVSKKKKEPRLKVALYNTRGDLLYDENLSGDRSDGPEETAALYLTALRNAKDIFSKPANKHQIKEALRRGFALYKKGDAGNALRFFEKAGNDELVRTASNVAEFMERATVELNNGDVSDAIGDLQRALEKDEEVRKAGFAVISYIRETRKTKRSEFDNGDFYEDILKVHQSFERRYGELDRKRNEEERKLVEREQKAVRAIEREIEQARKEIEKNEEKMNKERTAVDEEIKRLLDAQEKEFEALNRKKDALRKRIDSLESGRNEFADKVERRADELKSKELEKLQSRFLKDQEKLTEKIATLERKDPPDEKKIKALENKLTALEQDLEKQRTILSETYRRGADEHLLKYDRKVEELQKQLTVLEKEESTIAQKTQKKIDRREALFKQQIAQWHKERTKREKLVAAMEKNSVKRIEAAGREAQKMREQLKKRISGEKDKIIVAEKEKISQRYTARFKAEVNRFIEHTAATKKIYLLLSDAYARLGERSLKDDELPEARRHFHRAIYYDPANKRAAKGVDQIRLRAVKLYEMAIAMSDDEPDKARSALETIVNSLKPTNPVYVRSFIALRELGK